MSSKEKGEETVLLDTQKGKVVNLEDNTEEPTPTAGQNKICILKRVLSVGILLIFLTANLMSVDLPNAFLPVEIVEVRGLKTLLSGVAVAAHPLATGISAFFSTELTDTLSLSFRRCVAFAGFVSFIPSLVFVVPITNDALFIVLVILLRLLQGFVQGMIEPQTMGVIYSTFPKNVGSLVAICEFSVGMSVGAGAAVGTAVYSKGNVGPPFIGFGAVVLVMSIANYFYPHPALYEQEQAVHQSVDVEGDIMCPANESNERMIPRISKFLQSPVFCIGIILTLVTSVNIHYSVNFIGLYFVQVYDKPVSEAGLVILLTTVVYGISISVLGILTDKGLSKMFCLVAGLVVMELSVVFYAPSMFGLHWNGIIPPSIILLIPGSIAISAVFVTIIPLLILHDSEPDHIKSSQKASGIFLSMNLAGNLVSSIFISGLLDITSFSVVSFILAVITNVVLIYLLAIHRKTGNLLTIKAS